MPKRELPPEVDAKISEVVAEFTAKLKACLTTSLRFYRMKTIDAILEVLDEATKQNESAAGRAIRRTEPKQRSEPARDARRSKSGTGSGNWRTAAKGSDQNRTGRRRP